MDISINKNIDTIVTTSTGTSWNLRNRVLHLGLHHFNLPSLDRKLTKQGNLGKNTMSSKGQRDADSSIRKIEAIMDYSFLTLQFLLLQCIQESQYIALQIGNGGLSPSILKAYGRPAVNLLGTL